MFPDTDWSLAPPSAFRRLSQESYFTDSEASSIFSDTSLVTTPRYFENYQITDLFPEAADFGEISAIPELAVNAEVISATWEADLLFGAAFSSTSVGATVAAADTALASIPIVGEVALGATLLGFLGYELYEWLAPKEDPKTSKGAPEPASPSRTPPLGGVGGPQATKPQPRGAVVMPGGGVPWVDPVRPEPLIPPRQRRSGRRRLV